MKPRDRPARRSRALAGGASALTDAERDRLVAAGHEKWHARRARGEDVRVRELAEDSGEAFQDLCDVLAAEAAFDRAIEPAQKRPLPRAFGRRKLPSELDRPPREPRR